MFACFGCGGPQHPELVPPNHTELSREELKALYEKSITVNKGRLIVHGIFARADTKNNNKRVYPKYILKREVANFEREHILRGTALGELDHPNYASQYFKSLNLPNISHQVLDVQWHGDQLWGSIEVLPTPSGLLLRELYSKGIKLGVSSRGWASLRTEPNDDCVYVDNDFELITFDFVTEPSTMGAYLVPISKKFKHPIPDQSKCVQISHLGHGVASLRYVPQLPDTQVIVSRLNKLQYEDCRGALPAAPGGGLQAPAPAATAEGMTGVEPSSLDALLRYSHYIVFSDAGYLHREQHARDYRTHLTMFATRAHLADQQQVTNKAELNAVILREIAKEEEAEAAAIAAQQQQQQHQIEQQQMQQGPVMASATPAAPLGGSGGGSRGSKPGSFGRAAASTAIAANAAAAGMFASQSIGSPRTEAECQGAIHHEAAPSDLNAWAMHPNALDLPGTPAAAAAAAAQQQQQRVAAAAEQAGPGPGSCPPGGSYAQQGSLKPPSQPSLLVPPQISGASSTPFPPPGASAPAASQRLRPDLAAAGASPSAAPPQQQQHQQRPLPGQQHAGRGAGGAPSALEGAVSREFALIKVTLNSFMTKYQTQQEALRKGLRLQLPIVMQPDRPLFFHSANSRM